MLLSTRLVPVMVPSLILIISRIVIVAIGQIVAVLILKLFAIRLQSRICGLLSVVV